MRLFSTSSRWLPLCLVLLGVLAACESPTCLVRGRIAVVLENGQTFKPGQAAVWLVEAGAAEKHLNTLKAELQSSRRRLDTEITRAREDYETVRSDRRNLNYQGAALAESVKLAEESGNQTAAANARAELEKSDQERSRLSNKELSLEKALSELETQRSEMAARLFLEPWPGVLARTTTDADGGFSLAAPSRVKMIVVAVCSRKIEDGSESWQWFVLVTPTNSSLLLLNNENLFSK